MNAERRQQLRQLAENAQGHADPWPTFEYLCDPEDGFYMSHMRLIAACSPDVMLALLDALDQADNGWTDELNKRVLLEAENARLRAALAPAGREQGEA